MIGGQRCRRLTRVSLWSLRPQDTVISFCLPRPSLSLIIIAPAPPHSLPISHSSFMSLSLSYPSHSWPYVPPLSLTPATISPSPVILLNTYDSLALYPLSPSFTLFFSLFPTLSPLSSPLPHSLPFHILISLSLPLAPAPPAPSPPTT